MVRWTRTMAEVFYFYNGGHVLLGVNEFADVFYGIKKDKARNTIFSMD